MAPQEAAVQTEVQAHRDLRVLKALPEMSALQDQLEPTVHRDFPVIRVTQDFRVLKGLVLRVRQDSQDPPDPPVLQAVRARLERQAA